MRATWLIPILSACGTSAEPVGRVWYADDYTPSFGDRATFVDVGADPPTGDPLQLFVANGSWEFRTGTDFDTGTPYATFSATLEADRGLVVDGFTALPERFRPGERFDNGTVDRIGEGTVAIGTYAELVELSLDAGPLAGDAAFVLGTGPVRLTLQGRVWEVIEVDPS